MGEKIYNILHPLINSTERLAKIDKNILLLTFSIVKYVILKSSTPLFYRFYYLF